jgi:prepilin-type N-terminal cleavage/methylation domain-containing protein
MLRLERGMRRKIDGFTLVEIMIVASIISILAVIALPSFQRARERSQNAKLINGLRVAGDAFQMYAADHNAYPGDVNRGIVPNGMSLYFGPNFDFTARTPIGGNWDWDYNQFGFTAGVSVVGSGATTARMTSVDSAFDDGDLTTGGFQNTAGDRYTYIVE